MKNQSRFLVRKVAVLGSGVMGSQIAAHFANANIEVILFDLKSKEGNPNAIVQGAMAKLQKLEPSPLAVKSKFNDIQIGNYEDHLAELKNCDLIIEAISEKMEYKKDLYAKVCPYLSENVIFGTNTSGLSIEELSKNFGDKLQSRFCGVHFFNPPRYMSLVEIISHKKTDPHLLNDLEGFLTTTLGKNVIRGKDTPNFISNRIGVFSLLATIHHTEKMNLGFDTVDALTGALIGRAKSATFRTLDVVGIDTLSHVIQTMHDTLTTDSWRFLFKTPAWIQKLIQMNLLGQKTGAGIYKKTGKEIHVLDLSTQNYRSSHADIPEEILTLLKIKNPKEKFLKLRSSAHPQAQFLWNIFRDLFHYCAVQLESIADNARDLDFAVRFGYGWSQGPFETWQSAGWKEIAEAISQDIRDGKTLSPDPLPYWILKDNFDGVHKAEGSYSPADHSFHKRRNLPVYQRQIYPEKLYAEQFETGKTVFENEGLRLWTLDHEIVICSFKTKMHSVSLDVLDGLIHSVDLAEKNYKGLILWQSEPPFCAGANLAQVAKGIEDKNEEMLGLMIRKFQQASMCLKYSLVPTIAAVSGLALGGGCEFVMHCTKAVAALETYMGLVEVGVGLLPAGGGTKEFALRAFEEAKGGNIFPFLSRYFENIAMAKVSKSAADAKELGYLKKSDTIVFHPNELLYVAHKEAHALFEAGYRPQLKQKNISVVGKGGKATFKALLTNMQEGLFISEYDHIISEKIATILCGGDIDQNHTVSEDWLLELEWSYFMDLLKNQKTLDRITYMLKNGKPLRN